MYGRIFESLYRGSMIGAGPLVFAVWPYVIANMKPDKVVGAQVELNPKLLAFILGAKEEEIDGAIRFLCAPDPKSTSKKEDGRRLMKVGEFSYRVVNGGDYIAIRNEDERREYYRDKKREARAKKKAVPKPHVPSGPSPGEGEYDRVAREEGIDVADELAGRKEGRCQ